MERIDIRYALAEVARDKRFVKSLQWRSEEIFFAQENLAACVVDGMHTIKTWTGWMKWYIYQGHDFEKPFNIVSFAVRRWPEVCCLCLVTAAENVLVQFEFWSLGPLSKTCLLQKWLPLSAVKAMSVQLWVSKLRTIFNIAFYNTQHAFFKRYPIWTLFFPIYCACG